MKKIITIVGARPQFIKAAMVSRAIRDVAASGTDIEEHILHTGQHYDYNMSELFFTELGIQQPKWNLACGNNQQLMEQRISAVLQEERPDAVIVYGDTYSTLAGAKAAVALNIPIAHVEAGLRSFNNTMPEEHNRVETDRLSQWLFCPTQTAVQNLHEEGITQGVHQVGDVMYDAALHFTIIADNTIDVLQKYNINHKQFLLATIHRAQTADSPILLENILTAFAEIKEKIILPLHPHTAKTINAHPHLLSLLSSATNIQTIAPVGYLEMLLLEKNARLILTDSGGVQKEAYFQKTPCITLRDETEWVETIDAGWNVLVGTNTENILSAVNHQFQCSNIEDYGNGNTAQQIVNILSQEL